MDNKRVVYIGKLIGNLTRNITKTTHQIELMQKLFADDKITLEEKYGDDFVLAIGKLFVAINKCEKEVK